MYEDISIELIPYLGKSKNLMECFAIIGYKEEILFENMPNILENEDKLELSVISIITSNSPIKNINYDEIIKRIYPEKPNIIKIIRQEINPNTSSVISSSCYNCDQEGQKVFKIIYNCYALRFYEKFIDYNSNIEYYVPKAFLIISEYPFFTTFYKICSNIYKINIEEKEIEKDNKHRKSKNKLKTEYYVLDNIPIEIFIHCLVNYIPSPINRKLLFNIFANEDNISIPQLSAYPYIDFDLCKIINTISIKEFIKIYLLTLLEETSFIFSPDLEKLNLLIYSLYILQYPLTDMSYFEHIKSFSKNEKDDIINQGACCVGINNDFNDININKIKDLFFAIDIEKKKIINKTNEPNKEKKEEIKAIKGIIDYVNSILTNKKVNSVFLFNLISNLKEKLDDINKKSRNNSKSFFILNDSIHDINIQIQEAFYDFIINILIILNKDYQIDDSCSTILKNIPKDNLPNEEKNFLFYFRKTDKYNLYFNNFLTNFQPSKEFKLAYLFCDEFTNLRRYDSENKIPNSISYFKVMDTFFSTMPKIFEINYNKLFNDFKNNINKNVILKNIRTKKNQLFCLDKKVINALLYYKNNKINYFILLKELDKMGINMELEDKNSLYITIQNNCNRIVNSNYFVRASIVYIFSIVFPFFASERINNFMPIILENIKKMEYFQRYYLYILLKSINKYYLINKEKRQYSEFNYQTAKNYCNIIKNYLKDNFILPNEELFFFLKKMLNDNNNINDENRNNLNNENKQNEEDIFILKYDQIEKNVNKIKFNIVEREGNSLYFNYYGKNEKYSGLSYAQIFQQIYSIYDDYFSRLNFSVVDLEVKTIIELIINLIYYLLLPKFKEDQLILFLYKAIIVLNKLDKDLNDYKENHKI